MLQAFVSFLLLCGGMHIKQRHLSLSPFADDDLSIGERKKLGFPHTQRSLPRSPRVNNAKKRNWENIWLILVHKSKDFFCIYCIHILPTERHVSFVRIFRNSNGKMQFLWPRSNADASPPFSPLPRMECLSDGLGLKVGWVGEKCAAG